MKSLILTFSILLGFVASFRAGAIPTPIERLLWEDILNPQTRCQNLLRPMLVSTVPYSPERYRKMSLVMRLSILQNIAKGLWLNGYSLEKNGLPRLFPEMTENQASELAEKLDLFFVNTGPIGSEDILIDIGMVGLKLVDLGNAPSKVSRAYYHFLRRTTRLILAKTDRSEMDYDLAARLESLMSSTNLLQLGRARTTEAIISQSMEHLAEATLYDELGYRQGVVLEGLLRSTAQLLSYWPMATAKDQEFVGNQIVQSIGGIMSWSSIVFSDLKETDHYDHLRRQSFIFLLERLSRDPQLKAFPVAYHSLGILVGFLNGVHGIPKDKLN